MYKRQAKTKATCWLVNTGWSGGAYGVGSRMKIGHTRALIRAALAGNLKSAPTKKDPIFGLAVPESCAEVPAEVLNPRNTWSDKGSYDETAKKLTHSFATVSYTHLDVYKRQPSRGARVRRRGQRPRLAD